MPLAAVNVLADDLHPAVAVRCVSGSDQVVDVAFGEASVHVDRVGGAPRGQVVLEVLVAVAVLDLDLDPLHTAGGAVAVPVT